MSIKFDSDLTRVADTVARVMSVLPPNFLHLQPQIELTLTEGLNNAVVHGNRLLPHAQVAVAVVETPGFIEIQIEDEGRELLDAHLSDAQMPDADATSGRGLALIRTLAPESDVLNGCLHLRWAA